MKPEIKVIYEGLCNDKDILDITTYAELYFDIGYKYSDNEIKMAMELINRYSLVGKIFHDLE